MIITYEMTKEGIGAQYQRIIGLLGIAKKHGFSYVHKKISVGHNYDNETDWDEKWDHFFNIKTITNTIKIDDSKIVKMMNINENDINNISKNTQNIFAISLPFGIVDKAPNTYYKIIQDDIRNAYFKNNINRPLHLFKAKKNIAIHIRVINNYDDTSEYNSYENLIGRFDIQPNQYVSLINLFRSNYPDYDIHIFSQQNIYHKYKSVTDLNDLKLHIDTDAFTTFHHLCNADVLVIAKSSFSYLTGIYNKNTVMYFPLWHHPLDEWVNVLDYISK